MELRCRTPHVAQEIDIDAYAMVEGQHIYSYSDLCDTFCFHIAIHSKICVNIDSFFLPIFTWHAHAHSLFFHERIYFPLNHTYIVCRKELNTQSYSRLRSFLLYPICIDLCS